MEVVEVIASEGLVKIVKMSVAVLALMIEMSSFGWAIKDKQSCLAQLKELGFYCTG